jgi:natural product precursor
MKTLGKLKLSSEKMLKNEELVHLRGGYEVTLYAVKCTSGGSQCASGSVSICESDLIAAVCGSCPSGWTYTCG